MYEFLTLAYRPSVVVITLNRPQILNAINERMHHELQDAFDSFGADPELRVAILTGAGNRAFCAGSDLASVANSVQPQTPGAYPRSGYGGIAERFDLTKPVIAAVNGLAYGGGFEIALACDIIVAVESAKFALPEPRVGAVAIAGGVHRLARQIGLKRAMEMILTGRPVTAREGEALSFVNAVTSSEALMPTVDALVDSILACSPTAIAASKEAVYRGLEETSLSRAIANQSSHPAFQSYLVSDDRIEGPRAFVEKRKPAWRGKNPNGRDS